MKISHRIAIVIVSNIQGNKFALYQKKWNIHSHIHSTVYRHLDQKAGATIITSFLFKKVYESATAAKTI